MRTPEVATSDDYEAATDGAVTFERQEITSDLCILAIHGDLDVAVSRTLSRELDELLDIGTGFVAVDLAGVLFMDSSALSALVQANERAKRTGQQFNLLRPSPPCSKVLSLTGLDRVFDLI